MNIYEINNIADPNNCDGCVNENVTGSNYEHFMKWCGTCKFGNTNYKKNETMKQSIKDRYNNLPQHIKDRVDNFASELVAKDRLIRSLVRRNRYLTERLLELAVEHEPQIYDKDGKNNYSSREEYLKAVSEFNSKFTDMKQKLTTNPPYQVSSTDSNNDSFSELRLKVNELTAKNQFLNSNLRIIGIDPCEND